METSFWFILIGLVNYGLYRIWQNKSFSLAWMVNLLTGIGIGALIGHFRPVYIGYDFLPFWFTALIGGLSTAILLIAIRLQLFEKQVMQYSLMIIMSLMHASIIFFLYKWTISSQVPDYLPQLNTLGLYIHILLISAISLVGFTFPKRLLKPLQMK